MKKLTHLDLATMNLQALIESAHRETTWCILEKARVELEEAEHRRERERLHTEWVRDVIEKEKSAGEFPRIPGEA